MNIKKIFKLINCLIYKTKAFESAGFGDDEMKTTFETNLKWKPEFFFISFKVQAWGATLISEDSNFGFIVTSKGGIS